MARAVSCIIQALDADIAGELGHKQVNRFLFLHENKQTDDECMEYWRLWGAFSKAIEARLPGTRGHALVARLAQLHDNLDQTRGVSHPAVLQVREDQRAEYWVLRSRIADDIEATV